MPKGDWQRKNLRPGDTGLKIVLRCYRRNAKKSGKSFKLTLEDVRSITSKSCFYCGDSPYQISRSAHEKKKDGFSCYTYNGIDRTDNELGYVVGNCVPCCGRCNRMKLAMTTEEFFEQMRKIIKRHDKGGG